MLLSKPHNKRDIFSNFVAFSQYINVDIESMLISDVLFMIYFFQVSDKMKSILTYFFQVRDRNR